MPIFFIIAVLSFFVWLVDGFKRLFGWKPPTTRIITHEEYVRSANRQNMALVRLAARTLRRTATRRNR